LFVEPRVLRRIVFLETCGSGGFPPCLVVSIPLNRLLESVRKRSGRFPVKLRANLPRVDRVSSHMSRTVRDRFQEGLGLCEGFENRRTNFVHGMLLRRADVEHLALDALRIEETIESGAMVLHMDPVPRVLPAAVDGKGL